MAAGGLHYIETKGIDEVEAFFDYAGYKIRDMREPLNETKDWIQFTMLEQFATEGARSGGWAPLAEEYDLWKAEHAPYDPILVLSAELLLDGDHGTPRDREMRDVVLSDEAWRVTMTYAEFDPDSTRAGWHQEGADRARGGVLPARPILDLQEEDYLYIEERWWDWLDELKTANPRR